MNKNATYHRCKSSLYRVRSKVLPNLPTSPYDAEIKGILTEISLIDRFLVCDDTDTRGATHKNLRHAVVFGNEIFCLVVEYLCLC